MHNVSGQKDPIIRLVRDLQTENGRASAGLFFAEGEELARRAFDYGGSVHSLVVTDRFVSSPDAEDVISRARAAGVDIFISTTGLLSKILDAKPTPECLAIVERRVAALGDALAGECPLVQVVERGENADNLGMLLRSTDAAGATGVVLVQATDPFSRRVVRGSRGAVFTVPIAISNDSAQVIGEARSRGLQVIATSARSDIYYSEIDFTKPTAIIVGNEHIGITDTVREMADAVVRIPMRGKINSLNIAVAASVVLYEAVRQRA